MKYLYLMLSLFGVMLLCPSLMMAQTTNPTPTEDDHHIKIEAETEDERAKTLVVPFDAWKGLEAVTVTALTTVETATYSVYDETGAVWVQTTAALPAGDAVTLPLAGLPEGRVLPF